MSDVESSMSDEEPSVADEEPSVADEEPSEADEEPSVVDEESSVVDEESSVVDEESSVVDEESSVVGEESSVADEESSVADEESSMEEMERHIRDQNKKMGNDLLLSIWLYFGVPFEYIGEIMVLDDDRYDEEFTFFFAKAVVIDILRNRDVHSLLFEMIFHRCTMLSKDVLTELDSLVVSSLKKNDYFSAFIRFWSILSDFILFLRCKGNFLNLDIERLLFYWSDCYDVYFEDQVIIQGGLEAFKNEARETARIYPYYDLAKFTSKYCNPGAPYNKDNIPALFEREICSKYQFL